MQVRLDPALYYRLLDTAPDALLVADEAGRMVLVNRHIEALFGYGREELIGQPVELLIPERFAASHAEHRAAYVAAPRIRPMQSGLELSARRRDGSEFPVEVSLGPVVAEHALLVAASIRDVSDRLERTRQLRSLQQHLLSAIDGIQAAVAIFDEQDRLVLCNSSYRHLFDLSAEVTERSAEELLHGPLAAAALSLDGRSGSELRAKLLDHHRAPAGALELATSDGRLLRLVERQTHGGSLVTIWDVTEDSEHEKALRRARAEAESASAAKSEFLASMSHELRSPLHSILGFAQLLRRDRKYPLVERHRDRIDHILRGGEHLLRLIDDVLDLAHIESTHVLLRPEPLDVLEIVGDVKASLEPEAQRAGVAIAVAPAAASVPIAVADPVRFRQILMNYGSNAIKYNRPRGTVTFRVEVRNRWLRIHVVDDGVGIPSEAQHRIFEPFQRAGQETGPIQGTGIGLTICKRLAGLMGGDVGFRSADGKGSDFWLDIPARPA